MRRAIVIASNGPEKGPPRLRYAAADGQRMETILSAPRCGYSVVRPSTNEASAVREALYASAADCQPDDEFLVYFGGHGVLDQVGLVLLLDKSEPDRLLATALPASDLMLAMRGCKARGRVLILDCCNAGQITRQTGLRTGSVSRVPMKELGLESDTFDILLASDVLEPAHELDEKEGGFMTWALSDALGTNFDEADGDHDNAISVDDAIRWLERRALEYNVTSSTGRKLPVPRRLGVGRGVAYLSLPPETWMVHEVPLPDLTSAVILPIAPFKDCAFALGRSLVTNATYRQFVARTGRAEPRGKRYVDGRWGRSAFRPWADPAFAEDEQPVVCVSYGDALIYTEYLNSLRGQWRFICLPPPALWDTAAFGTPFPGRDPKGWCRIQPSIHHKAVCPASCVDVPERTNRLGLTDMIGNVWEWCGETTRWHTILSKGEVEGGSVFVGPSISAGVVSAGVVGRGFGFSSPIEPPIRVERRSRADSSNVEIRGGSFYDDLELTVPFVEGRDVYDGSEARHTDVGFRIAGLIPTLVLPEVTQHALTRCPPLRLPRFNTPPAA